MSFATISSPRNGTEASNFHIRNTMTAIITVPGNRLVCIIACDSTTSGVDKEGGKGGGGSAPIMS